MINKVATSTIPSPQDQQQTASSNDLDWDRYVREINDLKTNPPKQYAATISYFTWYHGNDVPAWRIPDFIATGVPQESIGPTYDKRVLISEPYFKILQANVPSYLRDIQEIDPRTGKPINSENDTANTTSNNTQSQQLASASSTTTTASQQTTATAQKAQVPSSSSARATQKSPSPTAATKQAAQSQSFKEEVPFDFTKLSPELQQTTQQLAEQLLAAALQRLSTSDQFGEAISSLLNRTA
jgi:hypothetical protein